MIVVVSNVRVDVGMARKFGLMHQHTQRSSRSAVRECRPVPKNWVAGGGAGGFRVLVFVTAVCVAAAVDDSVDGTCHCVQVSMSNRLASNDHAHSTHRVSLELLSQDSMTVPARLSLV